MNDNTAESISDFLAKWGYTAVRINTAETLTPILQDNENSLIIFQFVEFCEKEFELFHSIRGKIPNVPMLATSPFISVRDCFRVAKAGAAGYLIQPFVPSELKKIIERYIINPST